MKITGKTLKFVSHDLAQEEIKEIIAEQEKLGFVIAEKKYCLKKFKTYEQFKIILKFKIFEHD